MDELLIAHINADMRDTRSIGREEDEVAGLEFIAFQFLAAIILLISHSPNRQAVHAEDRHDKARAVKT